MNTILTPASMPSYQWFTNLSPQRRSWCDCSCLSVVHKPLPAASQMVRLQLTVVPKPGAGVSGSRTSPRSGSAGATAAGRRRRAVVPKPGRARPDAGAAPALRRL